MTIRWECSFLTWSRQRTQIQKIHFKSESVPLVLESTSSRRGGIFRRCVLRSFLICIALLSDRTHVVYSNLCARLLGRSTIGIGLVACLLFQLMRPPIGAELDRRCAVGMSSIQIYAPAYCGGARSALGRLHVYYIYPMFCFLDRSTMYIMNFEDLPAGVCGTASADVAQYARFGSAQLFGAL